MSTKAVTAPASPKPVLHAPKPASRAAYVLPRNTNIPSIPRTEADELDIYGNQVFGVHSTFDVPMLEPSETQGMSRIAARADFTDVMMPDGTEIARGSARFTVYAKAGKVVGISDTVSYGPETVFVERSQSVSDAKLHSGGVLMQGGKSIGLAPHSDATFNGVRITSGNSDVSVTYVAPNRFIINGSGATITETPPTTVLIAGKLAVRTSKSSYDVDGGITIGANGQTIAADSGTLRHIVRISSPPPAQAQQLDLKDGRIGLVRVPDGQLFIDGVSDRDFDQGQTGDCWFVASVLAIAAMRPEMIERMITDNHDNSYTVHLFKDGRPVNVTVDDDFYQHTERFYKPPSMVYGSSRNPRELWGPILEKALAAIDPQGYQGIYGGWPRNAFKELTGLDSEDITNKNVSADALFQRIAKNVAARIPQVGVSGVPYKDAADESRLDKAMQEQWGLRNWHAYAITGTQIEDGHRYILMRNTADDIEFTGNGYDADVDVDGKRGKDGFFRIRIEDYQKLFGMTTPLRMRAA